MTLITSVWAGLGATDNVGYCVPFIDPNELVPAVDTGASGLLPNFAYREDYATLGGGALSVGVFGDLSGTDPINSGGQIDSYIPVGNQVPATVGGVPGHSVSASRGTRASPAIIVTGDLLGEFAGYGLVTTAGSNSYQKLAGISILASGVSGTYPGGKLQLGTRVDGGAAFNTVLEIGNSAVDYFTMSAVANQVTLSVGGVNADVNVAVTAKGSGGIFLTAGGGIGAQVANVAGSTRWLTFSGHATTNPTLSASAGDINVATNLDLSAKVLKINTIQVVGARDVGWSAMTGAANKVTVYDVTTVTLAQLAGRVAQLQASLTTHGLLGA